MESEYRLTAGGPSRKTMVVSFVQQFWARWGVGPSYGKIADAMGLSRSTVRDAVRRAEHDGYLRRPGSTKGGVCLASTISPSRPGPIEAADLLEQLRAAGFVVLGTIIASDGRTICPLPLVPELDHIPSGDDGDEHDEAADDRRTGGHADDYRTGAQEGPRRAA